MRLLNFIFIFSMGLFSCATQSSTQPYYLQKFEPENLQFVGVSSKEGVSFGEMIDPDGYVHVIVVGQRIGTRYVVKKLIKGEDSDRVILTKIIQDPDSKEVKTDDIELKVGKIKK